MINYTQLNLQSLLVAATSQWLLVLVEYAYNKHMNSTFIQYDLSF